MKPNEITDYTFRTHRSYSVKEIMDAGGPDAFGAVSGKTMATLIAKLEELPPIEPFSDEEWADLLIQMANDK